METRLINILEGSVKLFRKYGLRSISMDVIAGALGISKKTLYQYVESKEDLISKVCEYVIEKNPAREVSENATLNAIEVLNEISRLTRQETIQLNPVVTYDLKKFYPSIYQNIFLKKRDHICNDIVLNIKRGIKDGYYRQIADIDLLSKLYVKNLMEIEDPEYMKSSSDKTLFIMVDTLIRALVNERGLKLYEQTINTMQLK